MALAYQYISSASQSKASAKASLTPEKAARLLLAIIERYPDIVRKTLQELTDASASPDLSPA